MTKQQLLEALAPLPGTAEVTVTGHATVEVTSQYVDHEGGIYSETSDETAEFEPTPIRDVTYTLQGAALVIDA